MTWPTDNVVTYFKQRPTRSCSKPMCTDERPCVSCRNSSNRTNGLRAQRKAAKATRLGRTAFRSQATNEEMWRGPFRAEVKSGKQVNPMGTAFLVIEKQGQQNKAIADTRPFCAIVMPEDWQSDGIIMLRVSTWRREIAPLLDGDAS